MIYTITVGILFVLLKLFFSIKIEGAENIPAKGAFILASNHSSYLDPPILAAGCYNYSLGRRLNFLAKYELFERKLFGWYIGKLGAFPIKRNLGDIGAIRETLRRIKKGMPIVIFPEGERSPDGSIKEGFPGIAMLAVKTEIPIIPAYIKGAEEVLSVKQKAFKPHKIYVKYGKPLFLYKEETKDYLELTNKIMASIKEIKDSL
ncbi:MAG: lysophospholipid acyltransferase family protein [Candidatus Omnitrophota bacterium]